MHPAAPFVLAAITMAATTAHAGPYCYKWNEAYSRGDIAQTAATHQAWIVTHLPNDILQSLKAKGDAAAQSRLEALERLVVKNCELHGTLPVTTVLDDLATNYRSGRIDLFR
ncbi:hypothetical protein [Nitrobacter sp.]|jgi:hypothetical protein|uniref:hypothetical protein n=1 Tax=Nitrobacter sp. TaxID=29420 RepID=UPI003F64D829